MLPFTLNIRDRLVTYRTPVVMGILNVTPDSFYAGSRAFDSEAISNRAALMLDEGADMIDIGACSTRPGSNPVSPDEEKRRLELGVKAVRALAPDIPISVDTYRADVADYAIATLGADIVNDIGGGTLDDDMIATVGRLRCPYIMMHTRGTPDVMQQHTDYGDDVTATVITELSRMLRACRMAGVSDVIVDPGFGFAKTVQQNYSMLRRLADFDILGCPVLVGVSRKSMITKVAGVTADRALPGTVAINAMALERGAAILRVHDVAAARQTVAVYNALAQA